jgi:hypothetical protein
MAIAEIRALKAHGIYDAYLKPHCHSLHESILALAPTLCDTSSESSTKHDNQNSATQYKSLFHDIAILIASNLLNSSLSDTITTKSIAYDARLRHVLYHLVSIVLDFSMPSLEVAKSRLGNQILHERDKAQTLLIHRVERMVAFLFLSQVQDGNLSEVLSPAIQSVFGPPKVVLTTPIPPTPSPASYAAPMALSLDEKGLSHSNVNGNTNAALIAETKLKSWVKMGFESVSGGVIQGIKYGIATPLTGLGSLFSCKL